MKRLQGGSNGVSFRLATKVMFRVRHSNGHEYDGHTGEKEHPKCCEEDILRNSMSKNMNVLQLVCYNLSIMITLGICVITGHVANNVAVISSLIIAAVTSLLSGLCYTELETNRSPASNNIYSCFYESVGEFPAFLVGWNQIFLHVSAIAATSRSLSAVLDLISGHQLQAFWLERLPMISSLNANPDLIAFSFVILTTLPFGLGMKWPKRLSYCMTIILLLFVMLFVIVGASHVDSKGWSTHHFLSYESTKLLSGAAVYTSAFCSYYLMTNSKPSKTPRRCVPIVVGVTLTVCFITYFTVAIVSTLLVQNRNVDSDVSLVAVFQAYNLHWAVYVMGAGNIVCLSLLLLHLANNLNSISLMLAFDGLIFRCISQKWKPLKTPLVPVFLFGGGAGIAAILFSVPAILEVMSLPSLIINTLVCVCVLHQRYQPPDPWQYIPIPQDDTSPLLSPSYRRPPRRQSEHNEDALHEFKDNTVNNKSSGIRINRKDIFPMVKQSSFSSGDGGSSEDGLQLKPQTSFDSDISTVEGGPESDTESTGTDIDTIVAEYKEKLRVATLTDSVGFNIRLSLQQSFNLDQDQYERSPTAATGRRVGISVVGLVIAFFIVSLILVLERDAVARGSLVLIVFLIGLVFVVMIFLIVILREPEVNHSGHELPLKVFQVPFLPWVPAIAAFLNVCMLTNVICNYWAPGLAWLLTGIAIYVFYGIWNSSMAIGKNRSHQAVKEKIRLQPLPRQPFLSSVLPVHDLSSEVSHRITEVDTIIISR